MVLKNKKEIKIKRLIVVSLVLLLAFSVFAQGAKEETKAVSSAATKDNPTVITCVIKDVSDYLEMLDKMEVLLAEDGIYVDFQPVEIQEGSYADAVSLMLQSGNIPDLIYFQGGDYQFGITQGILEDLRPYIQS